MNNLSAESAARFERVDHGETVTVYVHGEVDIAERGAFGQAIRDALTVARTALYLDLSDVSFIDSSGVHELLGARREIGSRNAQLVLLAPSVPVLRILEICCLIDLFDIRDRMNGFSPPGSRLGH